MDELPEEYATVIGRAGGEKPSRIAAWLNSFGFVDTGATLNGFLK